MAQSHSHRVSQYFLEKEEISISLLPLFYSPNRKISPGSEEKEACSASRTRVKAYKRIGADRNGDQSGNEISNDAFSRITYTS